MKRKDGVKKLWEEVFSSDSKEFVRMYFDRVYRDENTFVKEINNSIVSAVQLIPYFMTYYGAVIKTGYISGASTLPDFEGKRLMSSLMSEAINAAYARGDTFMTLIPANEGLKDFYKRFGFTSVFSKNDAVFNSDGNCATVSLTRINEDNMERFYAFFNRKMSERKNCIQHTYDDFINICKDNGMMVYASETAKSISAMACCAETQDGVIVKELLYENEASKDILLNDLCRTFSLQQIIYRDFYSAPYGIEYGMGRIINVRNVLSLFASNNNWLSLVFRISDDIIEGNNCCYKLDNGNVDVVNESDVNDYSDMTVEELMKHIKKYNTDNSPDDPFCMSLMLD